MGEDKNSWIYIVCIIIESWHLHKLSLAIGAWIIYQKWTYIKYQVCVSYAGFFFCNFQKKLQKIVGHNIELDFKKYIKDNIFGAQYLLIHSINIISVHFVVC